MQTGRLTPQGDALGEDNKLALMAIYEQEGRKQLLEKWMLAEDIKAGVRDRHLFDPMKPPEDWQEQRARMSQGISDLAIATNQKERWVLLTKQLAVATRAAANYAGKWTDAAKVAMTRVETEHNHLMSQAQSLSLIHI